MYIYKITNTSNGKVYIGKSVNPAQRWKRHVYLANKGFHKHLYAAIRKYGEESFEMLVIEKCADDLANEREKYWIQFYDSINREKGYNKTLGGEGGNTWLLNDHKEATSALLSRKLKGHSVNWEAVKKLADARRGSTLPVGMRQKISETLKKKYQSGELTPNPPPHYDRTGEHHSKKSKELMSEARAGKTYEQIYGALADEQKELRRKRWLGDSNPRYKAVDVNTIIS